MEITNILISVNSFFFLGGGGGAVGRGREREETLMQAPQSAWSLMWGSIL